MKKKLYIVIQGDPGFLYCMLIADHGEVLYSHICSSKGWAKDDLIESRPERIKECNEKYGEGMWEVEYLEDQTEMTDEELLRRNHALTENQTEQ